MKSSVEKVGKTVTQIIQFENGEQKTFEGIITSSIRVGKFTKFKTKSGMLVAIQHDKVNWFETHEE